MNLDFLLSSLWGSHMFCRFLQSWFGQSVKVTDPWSQGSSWDVGFPLVNVIYSRLSKLHCEHCALTHVNLQSGSDEHNQKAQFSKNPSFLFHLNEWFLDFRSFCNKVRTFVVTRPFFVLRLVKIISYRLKLQSVRWRCVWCVVSADVVRCLTE